MSPTRAIDDDAKELAIISARKGISFEGIAHLLCCDRKTLYAERQRDPGFNSDLLRALALYEVEMVERMNAGDSDAGLAKSILVQRFPHRHGADPRLRITAQQAKEGYDSDLDDPSINPAVESTAAVIGRLVDRMLNEDEGAPNANRSD